MRKEYRRNKAKEKFINYLCKTWKNKICAIAMIICGMLGIVIEKDATALVFMLLIAVPMFFSKRNWFYVNN